MELMGWMEWMAWTTPTALFFLFIFLSLLLLLAAEIRFPTQKRKGLLPLPTTRGDRFFIGLLLTAFCHLFWIGLVDAGVWGATVLSGLFFLPLMRWG